MEEFKPITPHVSCLLDTNRTDNIQQQRELNTIMFSGNAGGTHPIRIFGALME
jgi:hypothetical protein